MMRNERNLDSVIKAKTLPEFLIAKDMLDVKKFNQHDSYAILATWSAQHRFEWACSLIKHFTIGKWFRDHDAEECSGRQFYINDAMLFFCRLHK